MPIRRYLHDTDVFEPHVISAMSQVLERVCTKLQVNGQASVREVIAMRIIDLARGGVADADVLADRVIAETKALHTL